MSDLETFNRALFLHINGGDGTALWLVNSAIGIADYLIYLIPVLLLALWLWGTAPGDIWLSKRVWSPCSASV